MPEKETIFSWKYDSGKCLEQTYMDAEHVQNDEEYDAVDSESDVYSEVSDLDSEDEVLISVLALTV